MGMTAQVEVTGDHFSSFTAPQGAGHLVKQMPPCVERTWAQLWAAVSTWVLRLGKGPELRKTQG